MNFLLKRFVVGALAVAFCLAVPVPECRAAEDDANLNKGALVGIFAVVVGVLLWVGFRSDMDRKFYVEKVPGPPEGPDREETPVIVVGSAPISVSSEGFGFRF